MGEMTIKFNEQDYLAKYNKQTGYWEVDLEAPQTGGIYDADIKYTNVAGETIEDTQEVQVWAKEKIKIETNKVFMWIFDYKDFTVKDIVEIADYEINIDEETNANTTIKVLKETTAKAKDITAIKINNEVVYWGIIENIGNEDGKELYEYTLKYITNIFNEKIILSRNVEGSELEEGVYTIKSAVAPEKVLDVVSGSVKSEANVQLWTSNNTGAQKWRFKKEGSYWTMQCINSNKFLDLQDNVPANGKTIWQYNENYTDAQKWKVEYLTNSMYRIAAKANNNFFIDLANACPNEGTNIQIYEWNNTLAQKWYLQRLDEHIMKDIGVEDFIAKAINDNFVNSKDTLVNKGYLEVRVKTHTKLQTTVNNVQENMYNLNTWMTNCTQFYNINYNFFIENKKLIIEIENKIEQKELIDTQAQAITNYTEVFNTEVVSKVVVTTNTHMHRLYLLNDRTTTTDATNTNRAEGKTERVYTANFEDAEQKALDVIKANAYNHNITFNIYDKRMKIGTPIAIKTRKSLIFDTYISAIKITPSKFVEYICGNIRVKFIEKLLKERNK